MAAEPANIDESKEGHNDDHLDGSEQALRKENALVEVSLSLTSPDTSVALLGLNVATEADQVSYALTFLCCQLTAKLRFSLLIDIRVLLEVCRDL